MGNCLEYDDVHEVKELKKEEILNRVKKLTIVIPTLPIDVPVKPQKSKLVHFSFDSDITKSAK